jgi:hypothetical protein
VRQVTRCRRARSSDAAASERWRGLGFASNVVTFSKHEIISAYLIPMNYFHGMDRICPTPFVSLRSKERSAMINGQLELSLENGRSRYAVNLRRRRLSRANWWFQRMRQIVDHAMDWQPARASRPEQMVFPGAHREIAVRKREERQICA